jgi:hypothetical protein
MVKRTTRFAVVVPEVDYLPASDDLGGHVARVHGHEHDANEHSPTMRGQLSTAEEAMRFLNAGNAIVTLSSKRTGNHFTFKIWRPENASDDIAFVALLNGPDNETNYKYMGRLRRGVYIHGRKVMKLGDITSDAPSAIAFKWAYERLARGVMPTDLVVLHEGRCGRCGRRLTHPISIASGIGPECATKM